MKYLIAAVCMLTLNAYADGFVDDTKWQSHHLIRGDSSVHAATIYSSLPKHEAIFGLRCIEDELGFHELDISIMPTDLPAPVPVIITIDNGKPKSYGTSASENSTAIFLHLDIDLVKKLRSGNEFTLRAFGHHGTYTTYHFTLNNSGAAIADVLTACMRD